MHHQPLPNSMELAAFLRAIGLRIPYHKVCDSHQSPWEAFCAFYFAKEPVVVWKASRGFGGKDRMSIKGTLLSSSPFCGDFDTSTPTRMHRWHATDIPSEAN